MTIIVSVSAHAFKEVSDTVIAPVTPTTTSSEISPLEIHLVRLTTPCLDLIQNVYLQGNCLFSWKATVPSPSLWYWCAQPYIA